jgi:hypothetical protein
VSRGFYQEHVSIFLLIIKNVNRSGSVSKFQAAWPATMNFLGEGKNFALEGYFYKMLYNY